jgi:hypothetical protein
MVVAIRAQACPLAPLPKTSTDCKPVAVLPPDATFGEFCVDTIALRGPLSGEELLERWAFRCKVRSIVVDTGEGRKSVLPADERDLTMRERERKVVSEAKAQGMDPVPAERGVWS